SLLVALGNDPTNVMGQLGHTDPALTLRVYTLMRRAPGERNQLKALADGGSAPLEFAACHKAHASS
ncbi:MAG: site-specific integrase, partial [Candidatus Dormibacteraeota bacterium]|nr:site-specific integrase [Candidatus Dormibacteraeota bacterium]